MKPIYTHFVGALVLTAGIAACVPAPRPAAPPVQVRPAPTPAPSPAPTQAPVYDSWMDAPQTPGDWSYRTQGSGGFASFGNSGSAAQFTMRCDRAARMIFLARTAEAPGARTMTVRTESATRTLAAEPARGELKASEARLAAGDRLLDAMALSKGRFAVEVPGTPTLYLPSWAEVTRVIEDCR